MAIRYWLFVHPLDRARELADRGYVRGVWGELHPLDVMQPSDGVILYSPRIHNPDGEPIRSAVQAGRVVSATPYQLGGRGKSPWRHDVEWLPEAQTAPIRPLRDLLDLTRQSKFWGEQLRPGWVEITRRDFEILEDAVRRPAPQPSPLAVRAYQEGEPAPTPPDPADFRLPEVGW